jgi:hypothetical protein
MSVNVNEFFVVTADGVTFTHTMDDFKQDYNFWIESIQQKLNATTLEGIECVYLHPLVYDSLFSSIGQPVTVPATSAFQSMICDWCGSTASMALRNGTSKVSFCEACLRKAMAATLGPPNVP